MFVINIMICLNVFGVFLKNHINLFAKKMRCDKKGLDEFLDRKL